MSAAHLFTGAHAGDTFYTRVSGQWGPLKIGQVLFDPDGHDVCLVVPAVEVGNGVPSSLFNPSVVIGEDLLFCGYPLGMEIAHTDVNGAMPIALVKGGVFSGAEDLGTHKVYLVDAANNAGFSGGPVVRNGKTVDDQTVIGIVSGYKDDKPIPVLQLGEDKKLAPTQDYFVKPNSGFMRVTPSDVVQKLIAKLAP